MSFFRSSAGARGARLALDVNHPLWRSIEERNGLEFEAGPAPGASAIDELRRALRQLELEHQERGRLLRARHGVAGIAAVGAAGAASFGAFAIFNGEGTGSGGAQAGAEQAVTFSPATAAASLYPGGSADVSLTVSNPNDAPAVIHSIALDPAHGASGFGVDSGHSACDLSALSFIGSYNGGTGWTVPAQASAFAIDLPASLAMATSAVNACQGATFTVYLEVGP